MGFLLLCCLGGGGGIVPDLYIEVLCIRLVFLSFVHADISDVVTSVLPSPFSSVHNNAAVTKMSNDLSTAWQLIFPLFLSPFFLPFLS